MSMNNTQVSSFNIDSINTLNEYVNALHIHYINKPSTNFDTSPTSLLAVLKHIGINTNDKWIKISKNNQLHLILYSIKNNLPIVLFNSEIGTITVGNFMNQIASIKLDKIKINAKILENIDYLYSNDLTIHHSHILAKLSNSYSIHGPSNYILSNKIGEDYIIQRYASIIPNSGLGAFVLDPNNKTVIKKSIKISIEKKVKLLKEVKQTHNITKCDKILSTRVLRSHTKK